MVDTTSTETWVRARSGRGGTPGRRGSDDHAGRRHGPGSGRRKRARWRSTRRGELPQGSGCAQIATSDHRDRRAASCAGAGVRGCRSPAARHQSAAPAMASSTARVTAIEAEYCRCSEPFSSRWCGQERPSQRSITPSNSLFEHSGWGVASPRMAQKAGCTARNAGRNTSPRRAPAAPRSSQSGGGCEPVPDGRKVVFVRRRSLVHGAGGDVHQPGGECQRRGRGQ